MRGKSMKGEDLEKRRKEIIKFAKGKWRKLSQEQYEDIGSFAVEEWLKGRDPRTSYQHIIIDYLRSHEMRVGTRGPCDALGQGHHESLDPGFGRHIPHGTDFVEFRGRLESFIQGNRNGLDPSERCIMILKYFWGLSEKEIGHCLGVSESRISQRISTIQSRIQENLSKEASRESASQGKTEGLMAEVLSFQRKGMEHAQSFSLAKTESFEMESFNAACF
jgi:hypothetical protein